jgi:hypothetical protein
VNSGRVMRRLLRGECAAGDGALAAQVARSGWATRSRPASPWRRKLRASRARRRASSSVAGEADGGEVGVVEQGAGEVDLAQEVEQVGQGVVGDRREGERPRVADADHEAGDVGRREQLAGELDPRAMVQRLGACCRPRR